MVELLGLNTGGPEVPLWLWILLPSLSIFVGAVAGGVGFFPFWRKRRERLAARANRIDNGIDAVLGCPADPTNGKPAIKGLVDVVPEIQQTLGEMNGRTMMDLVHDIDNRLRSMERSDQRGRR